MKIAIVAVGTRGDIQPYIALAVGLRAAGYEMLIISAKNEQSFVERLNLPFLPLNVDIEQLLETGEAAHMQKGHNAFAFIKGHLSSSAKLKDLMLQAQYKIYEACSDADVIIYHPGMPLSFYQAAHSGKVSILASVFPVIPTKLYPAILFYPGPRYGKWYNLLTHAVFQRVFWALSKFSVKQFWQKQVKATVNFSAPPILQQIKSGMPVLNGYSATLFCHDADWPRNIHTTGSWFLDPEPGFVPDVQLDNFIAQGPTIYIGFGSMKAADSFSRMFALITDALQLCKQRAVVALGWSNLPGEVPVPENVYLVKSVPHSWLFPKMTAVVHHGGAGTTAAGLNAGKPTVIIPHNADQPAWGRRVYELGVGPKPVSRNKLDAVILADLILYAIRPDVIHKAASLGTILAKENGVKDAVNLINAYLSKLPK